LRLVVVTAVVRRCFERICGEVDAGEVDECFRQHRGDVLDERFRPNKGAQHTNLMAVARRRSDPEPDEQLGVWD